MFFRKSYFIYFSIFFLSFHRKFIVQLEIMMVILYQALPANVCIIISYNQGNAKKKRGGQLALSLANSHFISGSILGVCQHSPASKYKFDLSKKHDAEDNYNNLFS